MRILKRKCVSISIEYRNRLSTYVFQVLNTQIAITGRSECVAFYKDLMSEKLNPSSHCYLCADYIGAIGVSSSASAMWNTTYHTYM